MCVGTVPRAGCSSVTRRPWGSCTVAMALTVNPAIPVKSPGLLAIPHSTPQDVLLAPHIHLTTVHSLWAPGATLANPIPLQPLGLAQEALGPSSATQSGVPQHSNILGPPVSAFLMDWFIKGIMTRSFTLQKGRKKKSGKEEVTHTRSQNWTGLGQNGDSGMPGSRALSRALH